MGRQDKKKPKWAEDPQPIKQPKWKDPTIAGEPLAWRFSACDKDGPFSWAVLTDPKFKEVLDKLREFETKTWSELHAGGCHPIDRNKLDDAAQVRLTAIGQDDIDDLMSFRLTGANRVWCIQNRNIMRVLWWDPDHKVCPWLKDPADRAKKNRKR